MTDQPKKSAMVNGKGDHGGTQSNVNEASLELSSGELLTLAQSYFASDFSNPERRDCPVQTELISLARSGHLPHDALRAHLFGCSECFSAYRTAMNERPQLVATPTAPARAVWRERLAAVFTLRPGVAVFVSIAALGLITFTIWTLRRNTELVVPLANTVQPQALPAPASPLALVLPTPAAPQLTRNVETPDPQPKRKPGKVPVLATVNIDLADYVALRDVTDANQLGQKVITLAPVLTRLLLRLPEGSLAGTYAVTLVDEFGKLLVTKNAISQDGDRLLVMLDLRAATANNYHLQLRHSGESPFVYCVYVVARKD